MTDERNNGGPAFPTEPRGPIYGGKHDGMTLRDWFAGQALAGLVTMKVLHEIARKSGVGSETVTAQAAYEYADAMIKERTK